MKLAVPGSAGHDDRNCQHLDAESRAEPRGPGLLRVPGSGFWMKRLYLGTMAAGDFRVFRLVLKLRRTSEVGGGTRQDRYERKLPNFQYPEECGTGPRFVATRAPFGSGCDATASMQCSGQNVPGATDRSCVVEAGSLIAAVYFSG